MAAALLTSQALGQQVNGNFILQVPDWNQPSPANYPADGLPAGGYPNWCSPTAGGNLMGYWEDVNGCVGLTDRQAYNAGPGYPGTAGTWEQGLYHDGMIEMGWFMDTGPWATKLPAPVFPPGGGGGTPLGNILPGLLNYATGSWTDNDYPLPPPPPSGTGIVKVPYPNTAGFMHNQMMVAQGQITRAQMWATYCGEIDAARPVEVSFDNWVNPAIFLGNAIVTRADMQTITAEKYPWDLTTDPHSVVGVGYIDLTPLVFMDDGIDELFVCQDGWPGPGAGGGGTGQYVAVPLDFKWLQNDYITNVPEPATMSLLVLGGLAVLRRRRRR